MKETQSSLSHSKIQCATNREQIRSCYNVMHQLRPHFTSEEAFANQVERQMSQGYRLAYLEDEGHVKAVTGFKYLEFLAWGKVIYIDDLVSDAATRGKGYGSALLKWVISEAKKADCDQVHLDSGHHRYDAHRFYLNHGFKITNHHFLLGLKE